MDYKNSLNLPKTSFPMKAGLTELEPKLLLRWKEEKLYHQIVEKSRNQTPWVLHDGPPYANGHIHMGTALNKVLKDIIIKSRTMSGYFSPYVPGWDCHGLPIEHQVDKTLGSKKRDLSQIEIREYCRQHAKKFVNIQSEEFQRLGILGEWENPYLTMNFEYEAIIARELGQAALDGRIQHSLKPVLWCGSCRTALAEAEVEYENITSDSIFVPFELNEPQALSPLFLGKKVDLVIWTTTPWTLFSNMGIAFNPLFKYGAYQANGRILVVARELAETLWPKFGLDTPEDLGDIITDKLFKLTAHHPLCDRLSLVVPADYVTLEQGTGLVHTAPGHGREDYETGLRHNLAVFSPLDSSARFTAEVPELAGQKALETNGTVIDLLLKANRLLGQEKITHQYPHCWRCKKPVVFRATPQWFISMDQKELRQKALAAIDGVRWIPKWGRDRIYGMVESRPDWCISRQRTWGVPITFFFCKNCGQWHYSQGIQELLFKLFREKGADEWYAHPAEELMPPGEKCSHCGHTHFEKESDILDVWFDSGTSFAAVAEQRSYLPDQPDMYLEGSDQHRGWFHSSLLLSVANRDRAPYREVLTHGYVVDGSGRKMSKSIGNTIDPAEVIKKYGADILRLWSSAENYQDDIRLSNQIMDMLAKAYFNFRNTARFILGNLFDFDPEKDRIQPDKLPRLDRYVLHQLNILVEKVNSAYLDYQFHDIYHLVNNFVVLLSSFYHDVIKDRLYTLNSNDPKRRASQTVMREVLSSLVRLMAPILSFTAEEIWGYLEPDKGSVFLSSLPKSDPGLQNLELANTFEAFLKLRNQVNRALEEARQKKLIGSSLDARVELSAQGADFQLLLEFKDDLEELFIVSAVSLTEGPEFLAKISPSQDPKCPRCWVRHPKLDEQSGICPKCQKALEK